MPAPTITSRDPAVSETNVYLNKVITITFSEALLASTVTTANFSLRHVGSNLNMRVAVEYDATTFTVSLIPEQHLWKNSSFQVTVIGQDSNLPSGWLKASDGSAFATTTRWAFQVGDDIDAPLDKTETVEEREGDLLLPPGLQVTQSSPFSLLKTVPANGSWGFTGSDIYVHFNVNVTTGVAASNIIIHQRPFLDESGWFAINSGNYIFQWASTDTGAFVPPTWVVTGAATGKVMRFVTTGTVLANTFFEVEVLDTMTDVNGNELLQAGSSIFTSYSYPNYITPNYIRNELFSIYDTLNLEFVHQVVWKWMINAYRIIGHISNFSSKGKYIRDYVKCGAIMDIMQSLWLEKSLNAGTMKTLGDFIIEYNPKAGDLESNGIYKKALECFNKAFGALTYSRTQITSTIRSWNDPESTISFRNRLWKNPHVSYNIYNYSVPDFYPVNNTSNQRAGILPGAYDRWS